MPCGAASSWHRDGGPGHGVEDDATGTMLAEAGDNHVSSPGARLAIETSHDPLRFMASGFVIGLEHGHAQRGAPRP